MIPTAALAAAGTDSLLVARPRGVAHVYVGPLTPAGYVPRTRRTVCRAHTRRLAPIPLERCSSLDPASSEHRLCARCSARLATQRARRAEPTPVTRDQYRARYAGLTRRDLWAQTLMAESLEEINAVAHASLLVLGHPACEQRLPVVHAETRGDLTLTRLIGRTRERLADYPNRARGEALKALIESGYAQDKAERIAIHKDREERIARLGFINATADEAPRARRTRRPRSSK